MKATEDCLTMPELVSFFDPRDDTLLKVHVFVNDINDNPPRFTREVFTGGITTASDFGLDVMRLRVRQDVTWFVSVRISFTEFFFNICTKKEYIKGDLTVVFMKCSSTVLSDSLAILC